MGMQSLVLVILYVFSIFPAIWVQSTAQLKAFATTRALQFSPERTDYTGFQKRALDEASQLSVDRYGTLIRRYAMRYGVDWRLIMAIMRQESRFHQDAVSPKGAYGLMQILPDTQEELAGRLGLEDAIGPSNNIVAGIYHFSTLYRSIEDAATPEDRAKLAVAAYNCGIGRLEDAKVMAAFLGNRTDTWQGVKDALPFLSRRNASLHTLVWAGGRPTYGYLSNWQETTRYVDNVMQYYREYKQSLE